MIVKVSRINYPIFTIPIEEHYLIKDKILKMIDEQNKSVLNNAESLCESDWSNDKGEKRQYFEFLKTYIHKYISAVIQDNLPENMKIQFSYDIFWFQRYSKNQYHNWHDHGSTWVMIYYLELADKKLSTEFYIPLTKQIIQFDINEGDLLLFPGNIIHRSPTNNSENNKTIISCNIKITKIDY